MTAIPSQNLGKTLQDFGAITQFATLEGSQATVGATLVAGFASAQGPTNSQVSPSVKSTPAVN